MIVLILLSSCLTCIHFHRRNIIYFLHGKVLLFERRKEKIGLGDICGQWRSESACSFFAVLVEPLLAVDVFYSIWDIVRRQRKPSINRTNAQADLDLLRLHMYRIDIFSLRAQYFCLARLLGVTFKSVIFENKKIVSQIQLLVYFTHYHYNQVWPTVLGHSSVAIHTYLVTRETLFGPFVASTFLCLCTAPQQIHLPSSLTESFPLSIGYVSEQQRFWRACADAQARWTFAVRISNIFPMTRVIL